VPWNPFHRRPRAEREEDRVWLTREARLRGLLAVPGARVVAHFGETRRALQALAHREGGAVEVVLAEQLIDPPQRDPELTVVVAERHPLRAHDERVAAWADAAAGRLVFHVSLEDPAVALFVGDSVRSVLDRLGMTADTPLQSPLVSRSIASAQAKVRERATGDLPSDSAEGWLQVNGFRAPR
jgi:hypothetical protein